MHLPSEARPALLCHFLPINKVGIHFIIFFKTMIQGLQGLAGKQWSLQAHVSCLILSSIIGHQKAVAGLISTAGSFVRVREKGGGIT